ncbi:MAG: C40 family peptidase [Negativicutes bacterium]|nr:C40 family peptidase [Negativicutes bacterium]
MEERFGAVKVPLAVLWVEPGAKRTHDNLILSSPTDPARWADGMDDEMRLWLVGKVETQVLFGERLIILDRRENWLKVAAVAQATEQDSRGYPGWLPADQVSFTAEYLQAQVQMPLIAVSTAKTILYRDSNATVPITELSYQTRLPCLGPGGDQTIAVRLPDGSTGYLATDAIQETDKIILRAENLVTEARRFTGLRYIWGGTSSFGFDCSGFAMRVYQSQGVSIPRDADDQARGGIPVDQTDLAPGDLLFFAGDHGQGSIHHVGIFAGDGQMIHAPNSRSAVREESCTTGVYGDEFCGARRYR